MHKRPLSARLCRWGVVAALASTAVTVSACNDLLDVELRGRIPTERLDDPTLASVLVTGVIGDFECAYNNYTGGNSVHSDEYETANSNTPLLSWGERTIGGADDDYAVGGCNNSGNFANGFSNFGLQVPMHAARFQAEDVFARLSGWTDAQVANRTAMMATVRAYAGFTYTLFGETYCSIAFDWGAPQTPAASLAIAEARFGEAITLAQTANNTAALDLARVGLARARMDLKKWAEASAVAALVTPGFSKTADRGVETDRRWNKVFYLATDLRAFTIGDAYRTMNDVRVPVLDTHSPAFNTSVNLWINTKYTSRSSPIRLASFKEAQLILAEAQAQQALVSAAQQTINAYRAGTGLGPLSFANQADAISQIIEERRRELSFEGGHRVNDLLRYQLPWKGANGSTAGANPYSGRPYGQTTCWPLPIKEASGV